MVKVPLMILWQVCTISNEKRMSRAAPGAHVLPLINILIMIAVTPFFVNRFPAVFSMKNITFLYHFA